MLGYSQKADEVDLAYCRSKGIPVLRRITGGTGVLHERDLAVSLALPISHPWTKNLTTFYKEFLQVLLEALTSPSNPIQRETTQAGSGKDRSPICFLDHRADSLLVDGRKVAGSAQTRRAKTALIHASINLDFDPALYARVFSVDEGKIRKKIAGLAVSAAERKRLPDAIVSAFTKPLGEKITPVEAPPLPERYQTRYSNPHWAPVPESDR